MKLTVNRKDLLDTARRASLPLGSYEGYGDTEETEGLAIVAENGTASLTGMNPSWGITINVEAEIETPGATVCMLPELLVNLLFNMGDDLVTLSVVNLKKFEGPVLRVKGDKRPSHILVKEFHEYPLIPPRPDASFSFGPEFVDAVMLPLKCVANDPSRPMLECVGVSRNEKVFTFSGSDAYQVLLTEIEGDVGNPELKDFLMHREPVNAFLKSLIGYGDVETVEVGFSPTPDKKGLRLFLGVAGLTLFSFRDANGRFPNFKRIIPAKNRQNELFVDGNDLRTSLEIVKPFSQTRGLLGTLATLTIDEHGRVSVFSETADLGNALAKDACFDMPTNGENGSYPTIKTKVGKLVLPALRQMSEERLRVGYERPSRPLTFTPINNPLNMHYMVMPQSKM